MAVIDIKELPISPNRDLKTVIGFDAQNELIKATYTNNGGETPDLSNYATTQYVNNEIIKVNNKIEIINYDIDVLEGRVTNLENNGGTGGGDTTELENRVTELENKTFNNTNSLEAQIYALDNRTNTIETDINTLEGRVTNLENNDSGDTSSRYLFKDENYTLSPTNIILAKADLKAGKRVVLNDYFSKSETLFEVIGYDEYEINDEWYSSISAIKGNYLYIWSTEFNSAGNVIPRKIYIPTNTTNLQDEITANTTRITNAETRINNVERVIVLDVSNGMSSTHFNTIFNDFQSKNYKYLLNVGNNDLFNVCSIQTANRSITAIGFDDYEGQMMCYTWFAPQQASVPELTKRQIMTEII